jgi:hypothetical protein
MPIASTFVRSAVALALLGAVGASQAAITVYTSQAAFNAAVALTGTDTFNSLAVGTLASPATRSAGSFGYTATATQVDNVTPDDFFVTGTDRRLGTDYFDSSMLFGGFTGGVSGIGGNFFATDFNNALLTAATITLVATDNSGSTTSSVINPTLTTFYGFVSTGSMVSLKVSVVQTTGQRWANVDNLVLASAIPEPGTYALMLGGLALVAGVARRKR